MMAGRVEERGRRDNVAESIDQTFINLQAGSIPEQQPGNRDSSDALALMTARERRKASTTRLDPADLPGSNGAAAQNPSRSPPSESSARRTPRERRKSGTTRLDLADVLGSSEAAVQMRRRPAPAQPDNQGPEPAADRRQRLAAQAGAAELSEAGAAAQ